MELVGKINISGTVALSEPMSRHTTFQVGGPADLFVTPAGAQDLVEILDLSDSNGIPLFILGGGANILVADAGIRGIVVDMSRFDRIETKRDADGSTIFVAGSGMPVSDASDRAADLGLAGLGFLFSMPGSVGGAVWMNARCYGFSVSDILAYADIIDEDNELERYYPRPEDFDYKVSPFQTRRMIILEAAFRLADGDGSKIRREMMEIRADRESKGHFAAPCAGSVFKNNHAFGAPSGKLIDSIGLRGHRIGGAKLSDLHANIIVNTGSATASDIRALMDFIHESVREKLGFDLDREVLLVGDWGERSA